MRPEYDIDRMKAVSSPAPLPHRCALCDSLRTSGSVLQSKLGRMEPGLWVCIDCQHKLARRVDDEGAMGG